MNFVKIDAETTAALYIHALVSRIYSLEVFENKRKKNRRKGSLVEVSRYIALHGIVPKSLLLRRFTKNAVRNTLYYLRLVDAVITGDKYIVSTPLVIDLERYTGELWQAVLFRVAQIVYSEKKSLLLRELEEIVKSMNKVKDSPWRVLVDDLSFTSETGDRLARLINTVQFKICPLDAPGKCQLEFAYLFVYTSWLLIPLADLIVWAAIVQAQKDGALDPVKDYLEGGIKTCLEKKEKSHRRGESSSFDLEELQCLSLDTFLSIYKDAKRFYKKLKKDSFSYIYEQCMKIIDEKIKGKQGKYNARSVIRSFLQASWDFFYMNIRERQ